MADAIAVLNAGSSSIKFALFLCASDELQLEVGGQIEGLGTTPRFVARDSGGKVEAEQSWKEGAAFDHGAALEFLLPFLRRRLAGGHLVGIGHRVVHGGVEYARPVRVAPETLAALEKLVPLAPLHQPHNLAPIRLLLERAPDLPQVACFDTAFHRASPAIWQRFALPSELHDDGIRRYGFHGLSYEFIASAMGRVDPKAATGKTVVLHLGNGASMCAMAAAQPVATTMGFTALDGLPMGTRCGAIDPGVLLYLMDERRMDARAIESLLYNQSGLLGVSGISSDMRTLLTSADPRAKLAIELYVYRIARELGSLAAALEGLDAIVFTAGIGEHSSVIRERVCRRIAWLGLELDEAANERRGPLISRPGSRVAAWVIPTNEELMIARHTRRVLDASA
jgi:acetate kinase